jgi:hypothetical protein
MAGSAVIGALRVNLGIDTAAFSDGLKKAQSGMARWGAMMKTGAIAAAAGLGAAIGGMGLAMKNAVDAADDMSKAAAKIGIPIEELSRLKYAADLSGVSFETLSTGVKRLSVNMAAGGKALTDVGLSANNADGSMKSASTVMSEIADKFASMPDGAEKTALAIKLFGKAGAEMIPLLNGGSEALGKLMAEADSFGQVFSAEMGKNAEAFNDNISRLTGAFGALAANLATKLLPYLVQFTDWMVANAPAIAQSIVNIVDAVSQMAQGLIQFGTDVTAFLTGSWATFATAWDGMVLKVDQVKQSLVSLGETGLQAISGLVTGVTEWLQNKLNAIFNVVGQKIDWVKGKFAALYDAVVGNSYIPDMVDEIGQHMGRLDQEMVAPAQEALGTLESTFSSWTKAAIDGTFNLQSALSDLAGQMLDMATNQLITGIFSAAFGGAGGGYFGSSGFANLLSFGGPRAAGGPVSSGKSYLVGERGPELFVPSASGQIVSNQNMQGMSGGGMTVNIDARNSTPGVGEEVKRAMAEWERTSYARHVRNQQLAQKRRAL